MNTATENQIRFINTLKEARRWEDTSAMVDLLDNARKAWKDQRFTRRDASLLIDSLEYMPRREAEAAPEAASLEGMHRVNGTIYKVQRAVHGSGHLYAKVLVQDGDDWSFEYAAGALRSLSAATRLTLEEAKEWGALYGSCCVCSKTLTNEESIAAGIGPVCAGRL